MQAFKYFFFLDNFSKKLNSIALVDEPLIFLYKQRCYKLLSFCIYCFHRHRRPILLRRSHLPAPFWWCPTLAVTCKICRLVYLLDAELEKI